MNTTRDSLRLQIARTQDQLAKMQAELEALDNPYGEEPPVGTDIKWYVRYTPDGKRYTFLAHRADDGLWYTSSKYDRTQRWAGLVALWKKHSVVADGVYLMRADDTLHLRKSRSGA